MRICELTGYGFFDTKVAFPGKKRTWGRTVIDYELEFYMFATGKAILNEQTYDIAPGTLLCARPGDRRASLFDYRCCYLHIRLEPDSPYRALLDGLPHLFRIINREVYGRLFEELTHHLLDVGYHSESDYINAKLLELFYYLRKDAQRNANVLLHAHTGAMSDDAIPRAVEFLKQHYDQPLTLADIARVTGYSSNYFHHLFTAVMGKTPQSYLLHLRIRQAKYLLVQSSDSLSEIAYTCGFSSQAYFTEQFKKVTYSTPGQYRRHWLEQYRL